MCLAVVLLLLSLKVVTLTRLRCTTGRRLSFGRVLGYLFFWPGMRPQPFLVPRAAPTTDQRCLWIHGALYVGLGAVLLWIAPRYLSPEAPLWLRAWSGMAGLGFFIHFGLCDLLTAAWRDCGVPVERLFDRPALATSLADFWGNRWNRAFSGLARDLILRPLARGAGPRWVALAVFAFSGLAHELAISVSACGGYGGPLLYFTLQGLLLQAEKRFVTRSAVRRWAALGRLWTLAVVLGPLPLLFHLPFLERVVIPFLDAIGAGS
jgi:alginate O-acetyltransferase complex protein AlgI